MKSWYTTLCGVTGAALLLIPRIFWTNDLGEHRPLSVEIIVIALTLMAIGWFAMDHKKR